MINQTLKGFTPKARHSIAVSSQVIAGLSIDNLVHLSDFIVRQDVLYDEVTLKVYLEFLFACHCVKTPYI